MEVKSPFTLQGGAEDWSRVTAGESGLISQSGGKSRDVSRVSAGSLGFHSSCHGDLRDPLVLPQESQVSFRIVRGARDCCRITSRELGLFSPGGGNLMVFLKLRWVALGLSRVSMGTSGNLSCCLREVKSFNLRVALWYS